MKTTLEKIKEGQSIEDFIISPENKIINKLFEDKHFKDLVSQGPILIIGEEGTGKTHILNAMHIHYSRRIREEQIVHLDSVDLMNDIIEKITSGSDDRLYDNVQLLLIDGMERFIGKKLCQDELAGIIPEFVKRGALVVMTMDKKSTWEEMPESFMKLLSGGATIDIKPLENLYKFKLEKKQAMEKESPVNKLKEALDEE